ncbi:MAG: DUF599 domain-containing protein [Hyphomicrobiaceae bacterium]
MFPFLPPDLSFAHVCAIVLLFSCWLFYPIILRVSGRGSLNSQLVIVRQYWIAAATRRQAKPFDAVLLGHITNSIAFFGSATLLVFAGVLSTIASVKTIHETIQELHFVSATSLELFALQIGVLAFVLALCFFSFTYALRKLIYTIALLGALPDEDEDCPTQERLIAGLNVVLSEAIKTFNFGIRGYYYAIATVCLFVSPAACIAATIVVTSTLLYRQLATPTAHAIQDYVDAAREWNDDPITRKPPH